MRDNLLTEKQKFILLYCSTYLNGVVDKRDKYLVKKFCAKFDLKYNMNICGYLNNTLNNAIYNLFKKKYINYYYNKTGRCKRVVVCKVINKKEFDYSNREKDLIKMIF